MNGGPPRKKALTKLRPRRRRIAAGGSRPTPIQPPGTPGSQ